MSKRKGKGIYRGERGKKGRGAVTKRRERPEKGDEREKREVEFACAWGGTFTGHLEFGTPP